MTLGKGRTILATVLTVIIAAGGLLFFGAQAVRCTLCNEQYMSEVFASKTVVSKTKENFESQIQVVAAKSNIPAQVFTTILDNNAPSAESAVQRLFRNNSTTFYNEDIVEQFENLCKEYLEGNSMKYSKNMIHNTAVSAAQAYSDSFGIKEPTQAKEFVNQVKANYGKFSSTGLLAIVVAYAPLVFLFSKRKDVKMVTCGALSAIGLAMVLTGIICLLLTVNIHPLITPELYSNAIVVAVRGMLGAVSALGAIIIGLSVYLVLRVYKKSLTVDE